VQKREMGYDPGIVSGAKTRKKRAETNKSRTSSSRGGIGGMCPISNENHKSAKSRRETGKVIGNYESLEFEKEAAEMSHDTVGLKKQKNTLDKMVEAPPTAKKTSNRGKARKRALLNGNIRQGGRPRKRKKRAAVITHFQGRQS